MPPQPHVHPIYKNVSTLNKMIDNLTDKAGEKRRQDERRKDPLNNAIERMHNAIRETQVEYE